MFKICGGGEAGGGWRVLKMDDELESPHEGACLRFI